MQDFHPADLGQRFEFIEFLADEPEGLVLHCRDRVRNADVAVRVLSSDSATEELPVIRQLHHPGIVEVLDLGHTYREGRPWFSMPLVAGLPFGLPDFGATAPEAWAPAAARLLEAVAFLHDRGWVHGDLRPANVRTPRDAPERPVLLDFGLPLGGEFSPGELSRRAGYVAPEVLRGEIPTPQADLYSIGVLAAASLTGRLPFDPSEPEPGIDGHAPEGWLKEVEKPGAAAWLASMLQRDKGARPRSAREALAALEAQLGLELADPADRATRLAPTPPIGRDPLLAELRGIAEHGGLAVVVGAKGSGRSTLLKAHYDSLRSQGGDGEHLVLGSDTGPAHRALRSFLADHFLAEVVPPDPSSTHGTAELGEALRAYEASLAVDLRTVVEGPLPHLVIEDIAPETIAGRAAIRTLERIDRDHGVVISTLEVHAPIFEQLLELRSEPRDRLVRLQPLGPEEIESWLGLALGTVVRARELAEQLHASTGGLPATLHETVAELLGARLVVPDEREWSWSPERVSEQLSSRSENVAGAAPLPTEKGLVRELLRDAEVLTDELEFAAARRQLALRIGPLERIAESSSEVLPLWWRLGDLSVVTGDFDDAASWFAKLRAAAEDPSVRVAAIVREGHALLAAGESKQALELLEEASDTIKEHGELADQGDAALTRSRALLALGRPSEARDTVHIAGAALASKGPLETWLALCIAEARAHCEIGELHRADRLCRTGLANLPEGASGVLRANLEMGLAVSLQLQGRLEDASKLFLEAGERYRRAGRIVEQARAAEHLGTTAYQQGDWISAIEIFETFHALAERSDSPADVASALNSLGCLFRDIGQLDRAEDSLDRALEIVRRQRLPQMEVVVLGNLAECSATRGRRALAEGQFSESLNLAAERQLPEERVRSLRRLAQLRLDNGDLAGVKEALHSARAVPGWEGLSEERLILDALSAIAELDFEQPLDGAEPAEAAIDQLERLGSLFEAARLRLRLASALAEGEGYAEAEELVGMATRVLEQLPAGPELERADQLRDLISAATRNRLDAVTAHYDALQELTLAISRERDLPKLMQVLLDQVLDLVNEERGYVALLDDNGEPTRIVARSFAREEVDRKVHGPASSVTRRVMLTRQPLTVLDTQGDSSLNQEVGSVGSEVRSLICVPILRANELLGLIYVEGGGAVGGSPEHKAALLVACADAASVAIENARLIEALQLKNDAIAIMAHELRTPLSAIVGLASVMLEPGVRSKAEDEELLGLVKKQAERSSEMVNRVLQLARMEAGEVEGRKELVDPLQLVVAAVDTLKPVARQANVKLEPQADDDVPDLLGDEDRLVQVAVNLVGNAVKFSPPAGRVTIHASRADDGGLLVVVEDEGPGIPADRIQSIFEPYQQAGPRGMRSKGVGLGLAISRQIVRQHSGWLRAANRPEGGARFTVWLPGMEPDTM